MKKNKLSILLILVSLVSCSNVSNSTNGSNQTSSSVENVNPIIKFENYRNQTEIEINLKSDSKINLPNYTITTADGNEIPEENVTIKHYFEGQLIEQEYLLGNLKAGTYDIGQHTFTFTAIDQNDSSKISNAKVSLNIYQKIFHDGYGGVLKNEMSETPIYKTNDGGFTTANFYLERGKVYYAEALFDSVNTLERNDVWGIGMLHSTADNPNDGTILKDYLKVGWIDGDEKIPYWWHNYSPAWAPDSTISQAFYDHRSDLLNLDVHKLGSKIKYAIARNGDQFYTFINDKLVETYVYSGFTNRKTCPGILLQGNHAGRAYPGEVMNMKFYNDEEAIEKINSLKNNASMFDYARLTEPKYDFAIFDSKTSFYFDSLCTYDNLEDDWWYDSVRANVLLAGHSKVEFDYEYLQGNNEYSEAKILISSATGSNDPTALSNVYSGVQLSYFGGTSNIGYSGLYVQGASDDESIKVNNHFTGSNGMSYDVKKYHIIIEMEPLANDLGQTKFTYTFVELDEGKNGIHSNSHYAVQEQVNWVDTEELMDSYFITFNSYKLSYKVSNLSISSL